MAYTKTGNRFYSQGREGFLTAQINWLTDDIRIGLFNVWNDNGTGVGGFNDTTQRFVADIQSLLIDFKALETDSSFVKHVGLLNKTATDGIADADDLIMYEVQPIDVADDADRSFEAVVLFKWTGDSATSPLICFIDTGIGLPFTPNAGHIKVNFSNGPNRIFKL
jgi:hypothetical protein